MKRTIPFVSATCSYVFLLGLLAPLEAGIASAVELRDAELVTTGSPILQNGSGTVQLEDAHLGRRGPAVFVPEPVGLWQVGSGVGLLVLLARRRRQSAPATPKRGIP